MQYSLRHMLTAVTFLALVLAFPDRAWSCARLLFIYAPAIIAVCCACFMSGNWKRTLAVVLGGAILGWSIAPRMQEIERLVFWERCCIELISVGMFTAGCAALAGITDYLLATWFQWRGA